MQKELCTRQSYSPGSRPRKPDVKNKTVSPVFKIFILMKLVIVLFAVSLLEAHGRSYGQLITLRLQNEGLEKAIVSIEKQTGYHFIYAREELDKTNPVSINVTNATLLNVLGLCFEQQPLQYKIQERYIVLKRKEESQNKKPDDENLSIKGRIINEKGEAVAGATIKVKGSKIATSSNAQGEFELDNVSATSTLIITGAELETLVTAINHRSYITVVVKAKISGLDQVLIMAYGETTKRLNTGNIYKITAEEIARQPVSNPLAVMQGRVPGMVVTQTSGVSGATYKVEIRGRSSLDPNLSRNDPLFIIDGVPFEPGIVPANQVVNAANNPISNGEGGLSPLNSIDPANIESIEILKDADATAIYGSRGANGVILISTKRGVAGKTTVGLTAYQGWSKAGRTLNLMDTRQYVAMRKEAIANDGYTPQVSVPFGPGYAPDLLIWDSTRYTDLEKILIGHTAHTSNAQLSLSGGSAQTNFLFSGGYYRESNVFSRDLNLKRGSFQFSLRHQSADKRFHTSLSGYYSNSKNNLIQQDLTQYINLPPTIKLYDDNGNINWEEKGLNVGQVAATNPVSFYLRKYTSNQETLNGNMIVGYELSKGFTLRTSAGYNTFITDEVSITPKASINPVSGAKGSSNFGKGTSKSWNIEPQADYYTKWGNNQLKILAGITLQERNYKSSYVSAYDYANDLLLTSMAAAGWLSGNNDESVYRYTAYFGRVTYNRSDKYILNLSARRDGSSRFGPESRFANFGAIGGAWLFSNERFAKRFSFLSFGKLRGSYGITGNDQIGDYKYLNLWRSAYSPYQGRPGLQPGSLFNPNYEWEKNRKLEVATELGFLRDRIFFSAAYYRNRSDNQLVNYQLPAQTGFLSIVQNFPALVQNNGVELFLSCKNIFSKVFSWSSSIHFTFPKNKLISFPGLASSSYASSYLEGKSLNSYWGYHYTGIDAATGVYTFEDSDKDGTLFSDGDIQLLGNIDPKFYGGFQNSLRYKGIELTLFLDFRKQKGANYLAIPGSYQPGFSINQPEFVKDRWQKPGDVTQYQQYTSQFGSPASIAGGAIGSSDARYSDASFIRFKNISLSYNLPDKILKKLRITNSRLYAEGQNLFIITRYKGSDPETQSVYVLPPLKTIAAGIQLTF